MYGCQLNRETKQIRNVGIEEKHRNGKSVGDFKTFHWQLITHVRVLLNAADQEQLWNKDHVYTFNVVALYYAGRDARSSHAKKDKTEQGFYILK